MGCEDVFEEPAEGDELAAVREHSTTACGRYRLLQLYDSRPWTGCAGTQEENDNVLTFDASGGDSESPAAAGRSSPTRDGFVDAIPPSGDLVEVMGMFHGDH